MTRHLVRRTSPKTRRSGLLAAAAISMSLAFGLSGCVASADDAAGDMHASVVQIAERAVAGDYAGALAALALLDGDVAEALESGSIDAAREQEISAAIDLVRADLEAAASAATPAPAPPPTEEGDEGDGNNGDGNDGDGNNGDGNNGNGNGNSGNGNNGKGNSGNSVDGTDTGGDDGDTGDGSGDSTEPPATEPPSTATTTPTPDAGTGG